MASQYPAVKNSAAGFTFYVSLVSQANTKIAQANPTLAAGDVKIAIDDGAPANLATLPAVDADFTKRVKVVLSQSEVNGDNLTIIFADAAGAEWCDLTVNIQTVARRFDDLAYPATSGRSMVVDASGLVDANMVKAGPTGAGTAQTAGDIPAMVTAVDDFVDTEVAAIKAKTDNLPALPAAVGDIPTAAQIRTEMDSNSADLNTIIAYVDELESRLTAIRAGYLDNLSGGAVALASDIAGVQSDTNDIQARLPAALVGGRMDASVGSNLDKADYALSAAAIDAILDEVCEAQGSYTLRQAISILLAVLAGVTSDNGATLKTPNGVATRVAATIDANNNRTAITLTP